jgi:hypothetical protein
LFDKRPPASGFWSKPAWEELVGFNQDINLMNIEVKLGSRYSFLGQLFTNSNLPDGLVNGADTVIQVEQDNPEIPLYIEYKAPQVQIDQFQSWIDGQARSIAENWGVKLEAEGQGMAESGFKLIVEEIPTIETRLTRQKAAVPFEESLYKVISKMHSVDMPQAPQFPEDSKLKVMFPVPDLPVKKMEEWTIAKEQIALGVLDPVDYLMERDPELTRDDAAAKIEAIASLRAIAKPAPEFSE